MINTQQYKQSLSQWLYEEPFTFHLTFNFNRRMTLEAAKGKLKIWTFDVLRRLYGRSYCRRNPKDTVYYVAFPEYGASGDNLHLHAPCRVDVSKTLEFSHIAEAFWKKIVPSGSLYVQKIDKSADDLKRVISYDMKDFSMERGYILSMDFASTKTKT